MINTYIWLANNYLIFFKLNVVKCKVDTRHPYQTKEIKAYRKNKTTMIAIFNVFGRYRLALHAKMDPRQTFL